MSKNIILMLSLWSLGTLLYSNKSLAQSKNTVLDPAGYVNKYNTNFNGIGPQVYVLPAPRSLEESLRDTYIEISQIQSPISKALLTQKLQEEFKSTSNDSQTQKVVLELDSNQADWKEKIDFYSKENNSLAYGLLNKYAKRKLETYHISEAKTALQQALQIATTSNQQDDIAIIKSNLASLELLSGKYIEAGKLEESYLQHAVEQKNQVAQALSFVKLALIQALDKDYKSAENSIIRKAIPLFNRAKFQEGKINAWITLAEIYRLQNKHTEAQWFLIQAKDLANEKNKIEKLSLIDYLLGASKVSQNNFAVAKNELKSAFDRANQENNKHLTLAIAEQLGKTQLQLKNYKESDKLLSLYWSLRKELFTQ